MLFGIPGNARLFLYCLPADMRKGFNGLGGLATNKLGQDPLSGDIFIFVNRMDNPAMLTPPPVILTPLQDHGLMKVKDLQFYRFFLKLSPFNSIRWDICTIHILLVIISRPLSEPKSVAKRSLEGSTCSGII